MLLYSIKFGVATSFHRALHALALILFLGGCASIAEPSNASKSASDSALPSPISDAIRQAELPLNSVGIWIQPLRASGGKATPRLALNERQAM
jgi:hypothetical protein